MYRDDHGSRNSPTTAFSCMHSKEQEKFDMMMQAIAIHRVPLVEFEVVATGLEPSYDRMPSRGARVVSLICRLQ